MQINYAAAINKVSYGICGLNLLLAFDKAGHEAALWPIGVVDADREHVETLQKANARTASYSVDAPSLRLWHQFDLAQHVGKGPHCAYPIFELTRFRRNELHHLRSQDILFVTSRWAKNVLVSNGIDEQRIHVAPLGVDRGIFWSYMTTPADAEETTTFVNIGKWEYRKGHDVLVEAFNKAFTRSNSVRLLMYAVNPCFRTVEEAKRYNDQWTQAYKESPLGDKIFVSEHRLGSQQDVAKIMAHADCGVFPSRGEGWGLETAEMLAMGKHVITTDYAGHTEFCTPENARLIRMDGLEDAHDGVWFKADAPEWEGKPGQWAEFGESQMEQLVEHMRAIHRLKKECLLKRNEAGIESMKRFSWDNMAKAITSVLER